MKNVHSPIDNALSSRHSLLAVPLLLARQRKFQIETCKESQESRAEKGRCEETCQKGCCEEARKEGCSEEKGIGSQA